MKLNILGSSSKGNCYILDNNTEALILEAGVSMVHVKRALDYDLRKVVGCLVTHQHGDHAKYLKDMVGNGIYTLALEDVWEAKGFRDSRSISIQPKRGYKFGQFKVLPFPANHDVPCVGYLIDHPETGKIMFLTDSCICEYKFSGLSQIMIECNYSDVSLSRAITEGRTMAYQRERLMRSHMELNTCKGYLREVDISEVANIVLLHLSENNSDACGFIEEVACVTGKPVYVAEPGLAMDFNRL